MRQFHSLCMPYCPKIDEYLFLVCSNVTNAKGNYDSTLMSYNIGMILESSNKNGSKCFLI